MADLDLKGVCIQVRIEEVTKYGSFSDCICYTPAEFAELKNSDIEDAKAKRLSHWLETMADTASKTPIEPSPAELLDYKTHLTAELVKVNTKLGV